MGRRGGGRGAGGGGLCGCALLAAALVASTLVIHGAGGLKQSHAPAVARKVLLSITNWHPQNYLDDVLHPSQVQEQRPERLGQDVPFQTGNELPNPHLHQVPAALPSLPVQPYAPHPKISADTPTAAPSFQKMPWYPQPSPTPTSQETSKVSIASPPAEFLNQRKPPLGVSVTSPPLPAIGRRMQSPAASPETSVHPAKHGKDHGAPVTAPSNVSHHHSMPANNTHGETHGPPVVAPIKRRHHHLPANNSYVKGPAVSPSKSPIIHRKGHGIAAPPKENSSYLPPANHRHHKGSPHPALRKSNNTSAPSHGYPGSPAPAPVRLPPSKGKGQGNSAHAPRHPNQYHLPSYSPGSALPPAHSPETPAFRKPKALAPAPSQSLLPPPTNSYCTCSDPLTNSPPGMTCLCVLPIKVELRFGIALYTFFTLVPELAQDIASGVFMNQSQVRVMGANAAPDDPEKTVVFIDLVPLGPKFDNATAFLVFERFCNKQVIINPVHFGKYDVLYVLYQGLPPSPPAASMNNGLSNVNDPSLHPLAADVGNHRERKGPGSAMVGSRLESRPISVSPSFSSSLVAYKGSAKTFNLVEMERATLGFDESRIIGEGGFGRVYEGILEDGERVAIKVLKRDDQQGTREFLAEVEMLSRLHHRNLVKLIGICTEGHSRCLVYELVPNGSVESHLHGSDKGAARFDWDARLKIALGAARALAYLHEDSSPRVIHRDFKSSNILLEHDFTPKVSDFGLARTALGEGNEHISTRVMGTFGYVAPEYAMTGHLLVKSDVYSYGVVLLELLTGRKPVDMLRPAGQENLVAWAGSLLTSRDGLESIIDPSLGSSIPFDSIAKVAAIASMCVQPEVDQRPFMGEVVQALKLVCNEGSEFNETTSFSQDLHIQDVEAMSRASMDIDVDPTLSAELFTSSARYDAMDASGSFRRYSSSGPLRIGRAGLNKERGLSTGSSSEHVGLQKFRIDSE
ncbi:receptor-like serine/threonine-protein kinase ALE2 isoform X5 [Sorghum bicolor]|uniref:receptor-like serine/threonine-protein kinase ALE2 isoform X5 n=1 Tax=Sorghum bicolor TaxID=4558 RepID=UPI000B424965|nr:receptor-like serine/threonine-protein kinase ALE2 isoform X5 [Sorghum bicolor]|eukprot:XP_021313529.1 receptor-like serine/threonine-protein kinase ALE2 isoform X5 [Sorghum bicolor]